MGATSSGRNSTDAEVGIQRITLILLVLPCCRFGHASVALNNKLYVFGGAGNDDTGAQLYLNDMYTLESEEIHGICGRG